MISFVAWVPKVVDKMLALNIMETRNYKGELF